MSRFVTLSLAFESDLSAARRAYEDFARDVESRKLKVPFEAGVSSGAPASATTFGGTRGDVAGQPFQPPPPIPPTPQSPGTPAATPGFSGATLAASFTTENDPTGLLAQSAAMRQQLAALQQRISEAKQGAIGGAPATTTGGIAGATGLNEPLKVTVDNSQAKTALAEIRQAAEETRGVLANAIVPYGQMARRGPGGGMGRAPMQGEFAGEGSDEDVIDAEWRYVSPRMALPGGGGGSQPPANFSLGAMNDAHINRWRMSQLPESSGDRDIPIPSRNPFGFMNRSFMSNRAAFLTIAGAREIMSAMQATSRGTQAEATGESLEDQFAAQMQGIDQVQGGMLGPIAGFLVDPNGSRRASLEAMARAGQTTNAGSASMRTWGEYRLRLSEEAQVSRYSAMDPQRETEQANMTASQMRRQAIQERNVRMESAIAQIRTSAAAEVSQMDSRDPRILAQLQPGSLGDLSSRMAAAREAVIDQMTQQQSTALFGTLNTQMEGAVKSINDIQGGALRDINLRRVLMERGAMATNVAQAGQFAAGELNLQRQPFEAQMAASFANQNAAQLQNTPFSTAYFQTAATGAQDRDAIALAARLQHMGIESDTRAANLLANSDAYGAAQENLKGQFEQATTNMDQNTDDYQRLQRNFQAHQRQLESNRIDELNVQNLGLMGEQETLQKTLGRDYAGAQLSQLTTGYDVRQASLLAPDEQDARIQTLQNERLAVLGFQQNYFDSFHGEALDLRRFDVTNPRDVENPGEFNQQVVQKLDEINQTLQNLGVDAN